MIAVNVADISVQGPDALAIGILVAPVIRGKQTVNPQPRRADGMAVILECDDERARAIVDVLRNNLRVRAYEQGPRGGWRKI